MTCMTPRCADSGIARVGSSPVERWTNVLETAWPASRHFWLNPPPYAWQKPLEREASSAGSHQRRRHSRRGLMKPKQVLQYIVLASYHVVVGSRVSHYSLSYRRGMDLIFRVELCSWPLGIHPACLQQDKKYESKVMPQRSYILHTILHVHISWGADRWDVSCWAAAASPVRR